MPLKLAVFQTEQIEAILLSPHLSDEERALLAECTTRTIRRYRSKQTAGSTVDSRNTTMGRPRVITSEIINSLCAKLTEHSTMYQDEMVLFLREQFGIHVTRSAISRALTSAGWSNNHFKDRKQDVVAYFFCLAENQLTQEPYAILRSWLMQLLDQDPSVLPLMESAFDDKPGREHTLTQNQLWQLFRAVGQSSREYILVVDGFDECTHVNSGTGYHTKDPRNHFLKDLITCLPETRFRVLVVSRYVKDIGEWLEKSARPVTGIIKYEYAIKPENTAPDVQMFTRHMVKARLPDRTDDFRDTLADQAASRSKGMFLWVKLLESEISPGKTVNQLRRTITEMPIGVHEAYWKEVEKIRNLQEDAKSAAIEILRWLLFAFRPLKVKELTEILAISDELTRHEELLEYPINSLPGVWKQSFVDADYVAESILGRCGSLIELRSSAPDAPLADQTVHFVHFSVKEYLLGLEEKNLLATSSGHVDTVAQTKHLSHICLRYLSLPIFSEPLPAKDAYPFLSYAAWA